MIVEVKHLTLAQLEAGLEEICQSPRTEGLLEMIVRRPCTGERDVLNEGLLDLAEGLVGDSWSTRNRSRNSASPSFRDMQLTLMNSRVIALVAQEKTRWPLAGDQLFIDFDLSGENAPAGTHLGVGSAIIEVTAPPHTGCKKFMARFGLEALNFVNSPIGRRLNLRGINAKVVQPGVIRVHDFVKRYPKPVLACAAKLL